MTIAPVQNDKGTDQVEPTLIRRLCVLFSSVTSLDYIVTERGISLIQGVPQSTKRRDCPMSIARRVLTPKRNLQFSRTVTNSTSSGNKKSTRILIGDALEMTLSQNV